MKPTAKELKLQALAKQRARDIQKKNNLFMRSSPAKKRVMIAQDIIEEIRANKYIANTGSYIGNVTGTENFNVHMSKRMDVQEHFDQIESCSVCALGACLMSATKFANHIKFSDILDKRVLDQINRPRQLLTSLFDPEQLLLIEIAFERDISSGHKFARGIRYQRGFGKLGRFDDDKQEKALKFGNKQAYEDRRMVAIMRNIIRNKGTFIP